MPACQKRTRISPDGHEKSLPSTPVLKLCIIGHARHGKDTVAELISKELGLSFQSSSETLCEPVIYEALKEKYEYTSPKECYEDRGNHRDEWFQLISDYNREDLSKLARLILSRSDIYVGMRRREELEACIRQGLFDHVIWVRRDKYVGPEDESSCTVTPKYADITVNNNGSLRSLRRRVALMCKDFRKKIQLLRNS